MRGLLAPPARCGADRRGVGACRHAGCCRHPRRDGLAGQSHAERAAGLLPAGAGSCWSADRAWRHGGVLSAGRRDAAAVSVLHDGGLPGRRHADVQGGGRDSWGPDPGEHGERGGERCRAPVQLPAHAFGEVALGAPAAPGRRVRARAWPILGLRRRGATGARRAEFRQPVLGSGPPRGYPTGHAHWRRLRDAAASDPAV